MESYENVTFDSQNLQKTGRQYGQDQYSLLVRLVINLSGGKIRDEGQAQYVLLGILVVSLLLTAFVIWSNLGVGGPSDAEIQEMLRMMEAGRSQPQSF